MCNAKKMATEDAGESSLKKFGNCKARPSPYATRIRPVLYRRLGDRAHEADVGVHLVVGRVAAFRYRVR